MKKIKAIKINPHTQEITEIMVSNSFTGENGMYEHLKCDMIEHYPLELTTGDILLVDEEGLYTKEQAKWMFKDCLVVNTALLVGNKGSEYADVTMSIDEVKKSVIFEPTLFQFLEKLPESVLIEGFFMNNVVLVNSKPLSLSRSLKVANHSPTGFNWGYGGSGPAQFALALLMLYVDNKTAVKYYQRLKFGWVSGLPRTDFIKTINLRQIMSDILTQA